MAFVCWLNCTKHHIVNVWGIKRIFTTMAILIRRVKTWLIDATMETVKMWNDKKSSLVLVHAQHYIESLTHASANIALIFFIRKLNPWMSCMELGRGASWWWWGDKKHSHVDVGVDAAHSSLAVITAVVLAASSSSLHPLSLCRSKSALVTCVVVVHHPHGKIAIAGVATTSSSLPHYDIHPHKEHCGVHCGHSIS